jgi:hypothetical protein
MDGNSAALGTVKGLKALMVDEIFQDIEDVPIFARSWSPEHSARPQFEMALPNMPGKKLVAVRVDYTPGAKSTPMLHNPDYLRCSYLLKGGVPQEKVALVPVWREDGTMFNERERAALAWAETVTRISETQCGKRSMMPYGRPSARKS